MVGQKKRDKSIGKRREEHRIQKGRLLDLGQNEGRGKAEVEEGRKCDGMVGEVGRGDEEKKVYCSGSTAGRDHGLAWLFGEQEDSKGEEGKGTSEAADEEGAPPIGDGPPRDGKAVRSCADEDYWYADEDGPPTEGHSIRESEEDDYMDIYSRKVDEALGRTGQGRQAAIVSCAA